MKNVSIIKYMNLALQLNTSNNKPPHIHCLLMILVQHIFFIFFNIYSVNITVVRDHKQGQKWLCDKLQTLTALEQT